MSLTVAMASMACSDDSEGGAERFEASPEFLQSVAQHTSGQPWRFEIRYAVGNQADSGDAEPGVWGEHDGDDGTTATQDPRVIGDAVTDLVVAQGLTPTPTNPFNAPDLAGVDVTVETVVLGEKRYVRMPNYVTFLESPGDDATDLFLTEGWGPLTTLEGDQWALIDLQQLPGGAAESYYQTPMTGGFAFLPGDMKTLVAHAANVQDLGRSELRGTPVRGLSADLDPADVDTVLGGSRQAPDASSIPVGAEIWVDDRGLPLRLTLPLGYGLDDSGEGPDLVMTLDLFDYGDSSIEVTAPDDTLDLTEELGPGMLAE